MRRGLLLLIVLSMSVIAPLTSASLGAYGTIVEDTDADRVVWYDLTFPDAHIAYEDTGTTSGAPDDGDAFFINLAADTQVNLLDIVLTSQGGTVGSQVTASNPHIGNTLTTANLPDANSILISKDYAPDHDEGGPDGVFGKGDGLFVDVNGDLKVTTGDIILTSPNGKFGTRLLATHTDVKETIYDPRTEAVCDGSIQIAGGGADCTGVRAVTNIYFEDGNDNGTLDDGEDVYIATKTKVAGGHYRVRSGALTPNVPVLCGSEIQDIDCGDTLKQLTTAGITSGIMAIQALTNVKGHDADGSGDYTLGDPVFIDMDNDGLVSAADIRLTGSSTTAGKQPSVDDNDFVHFLKDVPGGYQFLYADANADDTLGATENIVLDFDGETDIDLTDVHLTSQNSCTLGAQRTATNTCDKLTQKVIPAGFGWTDNNNNGVLDIGDHVYIDQTGASPLTANDVRVTAYANKQPGTRLTTSDTAELSDTLNLIPSDRLRYVDVDGNGVVSHGDHFYIDHDDNKYVTPGDIRLSNGIKGGGYGTFVEHDDSDVVPVLTPTPGDGSLDSYDANRNGRDINDPVILFTKTSAPGTIALFDLYLTAGIAGQAAGSFVSASDSAIGEVTDGSTVLICYTDLVADGSLGPGDGVYAVFAADCTGKVAPLDARISVPSKTPGSRVTASSSDAQQPYSTPPGIMKVMFYDVYGDGTLGSGDLIYLNVDDTAEQTGPGIGLVSVSDVRLSGTGGATTSTQTQTTKTGGGSTGGGGTTDGSTTGGSTTDGTTGGSTTDGTTDGSATDGTTDGSTDGSDGGAVVPTTADLQAANEALGRSLEVRRDGTDNVLSWDPVSGVSGYEVHRSTSPWQRIATLSPDASSYRDVDAKAGAKYIVTAYYELGDGSLFGSVQDVGADPPAGVDTDGVQGPGGEQLVPGFGVAVLLAVLGVAVLVRRW